MEQNNLPPALPQQPPTPVMEEVPQATAIRLVAGGIGGFLAAIVGAFIWGQVAKLLTYESGIIALGMGFLCGYAVKFFSQGGYGLMYQLIAVGSSVWGIFLGKYYAFYIYVKDGLVNDYGSEILQEIPSLFSTEMFSFFLEKFGEIANLFDILFFGFAIYYSWRMLGKAQPSQQIVSSKQ